MDGIVIDAKVFSRRGVEKDERTRLIEDTDIAKFEKDRDNELAVIAEVAHARLSDLLVGQTCFAPLKKGKKTLLPKGEPIEAKQLADISLAQFEGIVLTDAEKTERVHDVLERYRQQCEVCRQAFEEKVARFERGDDLPPGVVKMVKVYVAMKRKTLGGG